MRILFIDDEINRMDPFIYELETHELQVDPVSNFETALEKIKGIDNYNLIILDCMLTRSDGEYDDNTFGVAYGLSLVETIRCLNKNIPIIILTVLAREEIDDNIFNQGISGYWQDYLISEKRLSLNLIFPNQIISYPEN